MKTYVEHIVNYYPKHSGLHNYESSLLIELKKGYNYPKTYFFTKLCDWIKENIQIPHTLCCIPNSKGDNPISYLIQEICFRFPYLEDGSDLIQNRYKRKQLHFMNYRSKSIVKNTVSISPKVKSKHILLLDDIVTTGTTMSAIEDSLLSKGAMTVHCLAIGKTWHPIEKRA